MSRSDNPGFGLGKKHRGAIGGQNSQGQTGGAGDQGIGPGGLGALVGRGRILCARLCCPGSGNGKRGGAVGLIGGKQEFWAHSEMGGHAMTVFRHANGIIIRTQAAIQGFINAGGNPALAGEKTMRDIFQAGQRI